MLDETEFLKQKSSNVHNGNVLEVREIKLSPKPLMA